MNCSDFLCNVAQLTYVPPHSTDFQEFVGLSCKQDNFNLKSSLGISKQEGSMWQRISKYTGGKGFYAYKI